MKLKIQLLLLALLSLLFPVTAWFAFKSVDQEFRIGIEQASKNTIISLKSSFQQLLNSQPQIGIDGFVPITIIDDWLMDGDDAEWQQAIPYSYDNGDENLSVRMALIKRKLALFIETNDASKNTQSPNSEDNDHLIIALANERGLYQYHLNRQAEGILMLGNDAHNKPGFQAYWHEKAKGYTLEILFDRSDFHHLGMVMVNAGQSANASKKITGTLQRDSDQTIKLEPLAIQDPMFEQVINNITPPDHHFIVQDRQKRVIYDSNKLPLEQDESAWQWIITPIYQWFFAVDNSAQQWFQRADGMTGVEHNIVDQNIHYTLKSMLPKGQQNMIQTLLKTSILMISVVIVLMLAYLLYAVLLAWRIKKLNHALHGVLDDSGHLTIHMPSRLAADEIGQLSRGIESMLTEMSEYTQYLKDLGARLSHEMKTPLAIVQSSLDNLAFEHDGEFLQRAQQGTKRLRFILNQLSELSRLKYALEQTPKKPVDLSALVRQLTASYCSVMPNVREQLTNQRCMVEGSAELIGQMIDKLVDNASSFTPSDGLITVSLHPYKNTVALGVFNTGSQLPNGLENNIFDSLVSIRQAQANDAIHLGLGLYVVQLISRYHGAEVKAENSKEPEGVRFTVVFKLHHNSP